MVIMQCRSLSYARISNLINVHQNRYDLKIQTFAQWVVNYSPQKWKEVRNHPAHRLCSYIFVLSDEW